MAPRRDRRPGCSSFVEAALSGGTERVAKVVRQQKRRGLATAATRVLLVRGEQMREDPSATLVLVLRRGSAMRLRKVDRSGRDRYRTDTSIARLTGEHTCGANTPLGAPEGHQLVSG